MDNLGTGCFILKKQKPEILIDNKEGIIILFYSAHAKNNEVPGKE